MPTYAYYCKSCGHEMDAFQKITEEPLKQCPSCKKHSLQRGPGGGIGLSFKGSGFYINDYAATKEGCPCGKKTSCPTSEK